MTVMSSNARRLSKSDDDQRLLATPKVRARSRKPKILVKRGNAVVEHEPIVGEIIWGILECIVITSRSPGNETINLLSGTDWESVSCLVTDVRKKEAIVVFTTAGADGEPKTRTGVVPRVDKYIDEPEETDSYGYVRPIHETARRSVAHRRPRKAAGAGR